MKGWVTVNTDAGFYKYDKVGSYAYWIKGDGFFLRGSGLFKEPCSTPLECEMKALINALHILDTAGHKVEKIIINRDNIYTKAGKGTELERKLRTIIKRIKKKSIEITHKNYAGAGKNAYVEFRHVKAHSHTNDARHWVNDWCDKQCKKELRNWAKQIPL